MSSAKSSKNDKSLQEKFKSFFKVGLKTGLHDPRLSDFVLTSDLLMDLSATSSDQHRIKTMKELSAVVRERSLQEHGVELLWLKLQDLLVHPSDEVRHETIKFFVQVILGQYEKLHMMRAHFFRIVKGLQTDLHLVKKDPDLEHRIRLLAALTNNGKEILNFEEDIGRVLLLLFPLVLHHNDGSQTDVYDSFMTIVLNMVKYNSTYLDQDVVCGLIAFISHVCVTTPSAGDVSLCLQCLDAIICYRSVPKEGLLTFVSTLCVVINMEALCVEAWRITRNLMGTNLGHSALYALCQIIQNTDNHKNVALVRGAVFYIGMSLWSKQRVKALTNYSPITILPTFVSSLSCRHHLVIFEVVLQTERLAIEFGLKIRATACDAILSLLERLMHDIPVCVDASLQPQIMKHVNNIITTFEEMSVEKKYPGSKNKLYDLISICARNRPEESVLRLIDYTAMFIYPTKHGWITTLCDLVNRFYKQETRPAIRIHTLGVIHNTYRQNMLIYEEELLERAILPYLGTIDTEASDLVRIEAVKVLTSICHDTCSRKFSTILDVLQRVMLRPLELDRARAGQIKWKEHSHDDIKAAVQGLIDVFCNRFQHQTSGMMMKIYNILTRHLKTCYDFADIFSHACTIRQMIFSFLMKIRTNESLQLGIERSSEHGDVQFSPYIICSEPKMDELDLNDDSNKASFSSSPNIGYSSKNVSVISLTSSFLMVIRCLCEERDWQVLKLVLTRVPIVLQNKALLSRYGASIHLFVKPLVALCDKDPVCSTDEGKRLVRSEFHNHVFPVLAAMAIYHEYLDKDTSLSLIKSLQSGLLSRECNRICIVALTACALEMKTSMYILIPQILLNFTKISLTKQVAKPMLEFVSTVIRLLDTFSMFINTDFMSVFAIALNFTNPFRFDAYTVALAHHVIIMWFLKCRLADRQRFVQFILRSLNHNLVRSFEEGELLKARQVEAAPNATSEHKDSSSLFRQRSSSLSFEKAPKSNTTGSMTSAAGQSSVSAAMSSSKEMLGKIMLFHQELSETCQDLLSRYMFANVSVQQKRLPTSKFLLKDSHSASWVVGNMVITITTSRCDHSASRGGLCDRCYLICQQSSTLSPSEASEVGDLAPVEGVADRRRHQSDFQKNESHLDTASHAITVRPESSTSKGLHPPSEGVELSQLEQLLEVQKANEKKKPELCACWCTGWAEVLVRRPSGDVSWMCRVQNGSLNSDPLIDFPLGDLTALFHPSMEPEEAKRAGGLRDADESSKSHSVLHREVMTKLDAAYPPAAISPGEAPTSTSSKHASAKKGTSFHAEPLSEDNEEGHVQRQSCDPILEVDESSTDDRPDNLYRRRQSLHSSAASGRSIPSPSLSPLHRGASGTIVTPPRTPQSKEDLRRGPFFTSTKEPTAPSEESANNYRIRSHTISGSSLVRSQQPPRRGSDAMKVASPNSTSPVLTDYNYKVEKATGISPQFVFLTLFHSLYSNAGDGPASNAARPLLLPATKSVEASLRNLDRIHAHETHKIGVVYVGPGQADAESDILANSFGSLRYTDFLHGLGMLIKLRDVDQSATFLGGLDAEDGDGEFAYMWEDDVMQVIFHVATLMPTNLDKDPHSNKKKRHIGNDFVVIVYNDDGGRAFRLGTIKGQFIYAAVVITPLDHGSNRVEILCKSDLDEPLEHVKEPKIVTDRSLAIVARQMALHCNLAAMIQKSIKGGREPYASNWLERLRAIKRLREKVISEQADKPASADNFGIDDFISLVMRPKD